jgi:xylan 1,4-beta-xylosidase
VDKPVLNFYRMARLMSGERVSTSSTSQVSLTDILASGVRQAPNIDAPATKEEHEGSVMVWNYHHDDLLANATDVDVTITGIPTEVKKVLLEYYRIDDTRSDSDTV